MNCQWQQINLKHWKCVKCGAERTNYDTPPKRGCSINLYVLCKHRSEESTRKESCPTCSGSVQIKIYSCKIYKECALSNKLSSVHNCLTCTEFVAK